MTFEFWLEDRNSEGSQRKSKERIHKISAIIFSLNHLQNQCLQCKDFSLRKGERKTLLPWSTFVQHIVVCNRNQWIAEIIRCTSINQAVRTPHIYMWDSQISAALVGELSWTARSAMTEKVRCVWTTRKEHPHRQDLALKSAFTFTRFYVTVFLAFTLTTTHSTSCSEEGKFDVEIFFSATCSWAEIEQNLKLTLTMMMVTLKNDRHWQSLAFETLMDQASCVC